MKTVFIATERDSIGLVLKLRNERIYNIDIYIIQYFYGYATEETYWAIVDFRF